VLNIRRQAEQGLVVPSFHLLLNAIFLAQNADAGYQDANCTNHGPGLELVAALLTFSLK